MTTLGLGEDQIRSLSQHFLPPEVAAAAREAAEAQRRQAQQQVLVTALQAQLAALQARK